MSKDKPETFTREQLRAMSKEELLDAFLIQLRYAKEIGAVPKEPPKEEKEEMSEWINVKDRLPLPKPPEED